MWLLPFFHNVAALCLNLYYRVSRDGNAVPSDGPVLLVANHPNSLLDPALVVYAARRPVRFLAKSTLFQMPFIGWLVRGAGSIPVYRRQDDPSQIQRNLTMFSEVQAAIAGGTAVGVFPEGISHSEPSLAALKSGAARIALGAATILGRDFPIVPIGLVFRDKRVFRSRAHAIVGRQVQWRDLAMRGENDPEAARDLTNRIEESLRWITINLEGWADAPIVETAEAVYAAELELPSEPAERIARIRRITGRLDELRQSGSDTWKQLASDLELHARTLNWFGLSPRRLRLLPNTRSAIRWSVRRLPLAVVAATGIWIVGAAIFWVPYRVTGYIGSAAKKKDPVLESTSKVIGGGLVFALWILLLSAAVALRWGARAGAVALVALPIAAVVALLVREKLSNAIREARWFFLIARRSGVIAELRSRQMRLATSLDEIWRPGKKR